MMSRKTTLSRKGSSVQDSQRDALLSIANSVHELMQETKRHDQIHRCSAIIQYIFVLIMGILYLVYGIQRYIDATKHYQVNTYIVNTDTSYPIPVTMVCQDATNDTATTTDISYVNIT